MHRLQFSALLGVIALATACNTVTDPAASDRVVGIIEWQMGTASLIAAPDETIAVVAPDTVQAGQAFTVTITTTGLSGCWSSAGALRSVNGLTASVTPWDRVIEEIGGQPASCTAALVSLPRDVSITFANAGTATLRVTGRRVNNGDLAGAQPTVIERSIVVR